MNNSEASRQQQPPVNPWLVMSVTSLGVLLVMINLGALNVALPAIARHFHTGAAISNWILLSYMLINTVFILIFGQFADALGRRKLYLIGMAVFTVVSLLIGFTENIWVFLILRVLQAAGGALVITNNTALITDAFPEKLLGKGLGLNVLISSAAQLIGPVIGGMVAANFGWQWVFWFGVPFGLVGVFWGMAVLRRLPDEGSGSPIDGWGGVLTFASISGLIIALSEGGTLGWDAPIVLAGFVGFAVLTPTLLIVERRSRAPMIDFSLFRSLPYSMANVSAFLSAFARISVVLLCSLYLQSVMQLDAFRAGFEVLPVTIGMLIASPLAGVWVNGSSARTLSTLGLAISALGMLLLLYGLQPHVQLLLWELGMGLVGFGSGLFMTPNTRFIMTSVPHSRRGFANGLRSMLQNMGQVFSTAISLTIIVAALPRRLQGAAISGNISALSHSQLTGLVLGYRRAFIAVLLFTLLGIVASYLRGSGAEPTRR